ncbi:MAG: DUF2065 domain-containing protein [Gammaproteobacteria bacterium SHHR-1]|uniref:DUF2065 domain-containing protein n=1 Tax=Magnetovirga frankeli TaxID=947516 RepID=UPI0012932D06|nr:DUF2065 domain-containing protein [gamma proteobacterium SS-5]
MWNDLLAALALVLVIEGLMPFLSPRRMRETLQLVTQMDDRNLRLLGLGSMVSGVLLLYLVR